MQPADEMKQPPVPFDDISVNKLKQLRLDFVLKNSVLFSSPEPWLIGELIVYPWSGVHPSVHNGQTSSSQKLLGRSKPNFMWSLIG